MMVSTSLGALLLGLLVVGVVHAVRVAFGW
jgi:hypothetical protein